jgi:uncharacterized surface anchored protein
MRKILIGIITCSLILFLAIVAFLKGGAYNSARPVNTVIIRHNSAATFLPTQKPKNITRLRSTIAVNEGNIPEPSPIAVIAENNSNETPEQQDNRVTLSPAPVKVIPNNAVTNSNDQTTEKAKNLWVPGWLNTTDLDVLLMQAYNAQVSLESLRPLSELNANGGLWFWQGRFAYREGSGNTANLGIGWRKISDDKSEVFGLNSFYDYAFEQGHSRVGLGMEYFKKLDEYRFNLYFPLSGEKLINDSSDTLERAVQGYDFEIGHTVEQENWLKFYLSGFHYDNLYSADSIGYRIRSNMQLTPQFALELGYIDSGRDNGLLYGKLGYTFRDVFGPVLFDTHKKQDFTSDDITYKLYQKVYRENNIKTESKTTGTSTVKAGSVAVTVTYDGDAYNGTSVAGVTITLNETGAVLTTDASGQVTFTNLSPGTYSFNAFRNYIPDPMWALFGYGTVTIKAGVTSSVTIALSLG